jgi:diacylglycerol kinase family enzyme
VIEHSWGVRLPGWAVYPYCAVRQIAGYPGFPVELSADGAPPAREELLMLVVANARIFGGGFRIAPAADLEDGRLDVVRFRNMGSLRRLAVMAALLRGTHEAAPEVGTHRTTQLRLRFERPPAYETDGEWNQARSAELVVASVPRALSVLVPASPGA